MTNISTDKHSTDRAIDDQRIRQWLDDDMDSLPQGVSQQLAERRLQAFRDAASPLTSTSGTGWKQWLGALLATPRLATGVPLMAVVAMVAGLLVWQSPVPDTMLDTAPAIAANNSAIEPIANEREIAAAGESVTSATVSETALDIDMVMAMAELDESEWGMLQDLEFAYWLSELPDASIPATDGAG